MKISQITNVYCINPYFTLYTKLDLCARQQNISSSLVKLTANGQANLLKILADFQLQLGKDIQSIYQSINNFYFENYISKIINSDPVKSFNLFTFLGFNNPDIGNKALINLCTFQKDLYALINSFKVSNQPTVYFLINQIVNYIQTNYIAIFKKIVTQNVALIKSLENESPKNLADVDNYLFNILLVQKWDQCGGIGYNGSTLCAGGLTCYILTDYVSQCMPPEQTSCPRFPSQVTPSFINWTALGFVSPVKNQDTCNAWYLYHFLFEF